MPRVAALDIVRYPNDGSRYTTETHLEPTWALLERAILEMHRFEQPLLWLCQTADVGDTNAMSITGGQGAYHLQIADEHGDWSQAINPDGSSQIVELWTSDQGFACEERFVWTLETTLNVARWYLEHGIPDPSVPWEST